jgi:phosphate transport system permease protein
VIGAAVFLTSLPPSPAEHPTGWLNSSFTAMPIQMFEWTSRPEKEFQRNAAAAGIILIAMTLTLNSVAIYLRARLRKRIKW